MKMFKFYTSAAAVAMFAFASCTGSPESDNAEVGEAQEVQEVQGASTFELDTSASSVSWVGTKPGGRHNVTFGVKSGSISVENNNIVGGTVVIDLNNIDVEDLEGEDEQKLAGHLKSPDFFAVEEHPEATFEIVKVETMEDGEMAEDTTEESEVNEYKIENPTHKITGNLTMRGNTKSITFPAKVDVSGDNVTAQAKFNIDRTNWGVSYGDESKAVDKAKDQFIYNTVNVGFDISAAKGQEVTASSEAAEN